MILIIPPAEEIESPLGYHGDLWNVILHYRLRDVARHKRTFRKLASKRRLDQAIAILSYATSRAFKGYFVQ